MGRKNKEKKSFKPFDCNNPPKSTPVKKPNNSLNTSSDLSDSSKVNDSSTDSAVVSVSQEIPENVSIEAPCKSKECAFKEDVYNKEYDNTKGSDNAQVEYSQTVSSKFDSNKKKHREKKQQMAKDEMSNASNNSWGSSNDSFMDSQNSTGVTNIDAEIFANESPVDVNFGNTPNVTVSNTSDNSINNYGTSSGGLNVNAVSFTPTYDIDKKNSHVLRDDTVQSASAFSQNTYPSRNQETDYRSKNNHQSQHKAWGSSRGFGRGNFPQLPMDRRNQLRHDSSETHPDNRKFNQRSLKREDNFCQRGNPYQDPSYSSRPFHSSGNESSRRESAGHQASGNNYQNNMSRNQRDHTNRQGQQRNVSNSNKNPWHNQRQEEESPELVQSDALNEYSAHETQKLNYLDQDPQKSEANLEHGLKYCIQEVPEVSLNDRVLEKDVSFVEKSSHNESKVIAEEKTERWGDDQKLFDSNKNRKHTQNKEYDENDAFEFNAQQKRQKPGKTEPWRGGQPRRGVSLGNEKTDCDNWRQEKVSDKSTQNYPKRFSEGSGYNINEKDPRSRKSSALDDPRMVRRNRDPFDRDFDNVDVEYKKYLDEKRKKGEVEYRRVKEIQQDLFAMSKEYSLAHCVAEDMRMGSGIAVTFKRDFKDIDELFSQRQKQGGLAVLSLEDRYIYYLVTKRVSNGKPTYETLWSSLKKLRDHMKEYSVEKLAIPRLGCGLDRLEWTHVKNMIEFLFKELEVEITVCNFQQPEDSPEKPQNITCKVVHVEKPIADIEEETSIIYLSSVDGHVSTEMEQLSKKFAFLSEFKKSPKNLGDVITYKMPKRFYVLKGCIVRKTKNDLFDFKSFRNCVQQISRDCKKEQYVYVAFQAIKDDQDDLINDKIITILKNYMRGVDVYICWDGDLVKEMPSSARE